MRLLPWALALAVLAPLVAAQPQADAPDDARVQLFVGRATPPASGPACAAPQVEIVEADTAASGGVLEARLRVADAARGASCGLMPLQASATRHEVVMVHRVDPRVQVVFSDAGIVLKRPDVGTAYVGPGSLAGNERAWTLPLAGTALANGKGVAYDLRGASWLAFARAYAEGPMPPPFAGERWNADDVVAGWALST